MFTKMGKKAWDFITQGKLVDEWFDTDTVTINGVVVNRGNYGSSKAYNARKKGRAQFKICGRQAVTSAIESEFNGDLVSRYIFPYKRMGLSCNAGVNNSNRIECNPFMYGDDSANASAQVVYFGSSDDAGSEEDYWLKSWLQNVWLYTTGTNEVQKDGIYVSKFLVYNANDEEVTVNEICCCTGYLYNSYSKEGPNTANENTGMTEAAASLIMIDRTVLETPLVIPAKSLGTLILK
nr:MAG TPA: hypothetical protein [Bacteriophage sp.]